MKKTLSILLMLMCVSFYVSAYNFMVNGLCYNYNSDGTSVMVTYQNDSYSGAYPNLSGSLIIPSIVTTSSGKTYSVTSIGDYAFSNCTGLNTAIIGENVTSIGSNAFKDCSFLENLVAMRERPIIINSNVFEGIPKSSCDLHVREGSKIRYDNQDVWKDFVIILEDAEDYADVGGGISGSGVYGDVNGDGVVTAADVTEIYNILLGKE